MQKPFLLQAWNIVVRVKKLSGDKNQIRLETEGPFAGKATKKKFYVKITASTLKLEYPTAFRKK